MRWQREEIRQDTCVLRKDYSGLAMASVPYFRIDSKLSRQHHWPEDEDKVVFLDPRRLGFRVAGSGHACDSWQRLELQLNFPTFHRLEFVI
jgi:hypothetical protein